MPLPLPTLDNRRWNDLVDEARGLIPRYAPGWTDFNAHDPGITLMELLAWLAEMNVYRTDQVQDRHVLKFLKLAGFSPKPPIAARTVLTMTGSDVVLAETGFSTTQPLSFRTLRDLNVTAAAIAAVQVGDGSGTILDRTGDWRDGIAVECLGHIPQPGSALYLGFTQLPAAEPLSLYLWLAETGGGVANLVWEAYTGGADPWTVITPSYDDTRSLIESGLVELTPPAGLVQTVLGEVVVSLLYLRCRAVTAAYDATPLLANVAPNSVPAEQAVAETQSFRIPVGITPTGPLPAAGDVVRLNLQLDDRGMIQSLAFLPTTAAGHPDVRVASFDLPAGNIPGQVTLNLVQVPESLYLPDAPVERGSLNMFSHDGTAWQEWQRVEDLDSSCRTEFHYTVDAASGVIAFGDGERGRTVPVGSKPFAIYRTTSAELGNVAAKSVTLSRLPGIAVTNLAPATGGAAEEDVTDTAARAVALLYCHDPRSEHRPTQAVNLQDYERLALQVPFTRVNRVKAYANLDGNYPCVRAPGVVTVVVIPDLAVPAPTPTPQLLRTVFCYLDRRRTICTQVRVIGPRYLTVSVNAQVKLIDPASAAATTAKIIAAINAFFDPRTGGPNGNGWPFGRSVYRSEILALIDGVPGVDHVVTLSFQTGTTTVSGQLCGNVTLCPGWLVAPGPHQIEVTRS